MEVPNDIVTDLDGYVTLELLLALTMLLCFPVAVSAAELEDAPIDESRT